jgi:hypothetical protein
MPCGCGTLRSAMQLRNIRKILRNRQKRQAWLELGGCFVSCFPAKISAKKNERFKSYDFSKK